MSSKLQNPGNRTRLYIIPLIFLLGVLICGCIGDNGGCGNNGGSGNTDITPGYSLTGNYETSGAYIIDNVGNNTFYLVANYTNLAGSSRSIHRFTVLPEIISTLTPADYVDTYCGLYWINVNENLSIGNVSVFNYRDVTFTSDRGKSNSNLSMKCWSMPSNSTVHVDVVYGFM